MRKISPTPVLSGHHKSHYNTPPFRRSPTPKALMTPQPPSPAVACGWASKGGSNTPPNDLVSSGHALQVRRGDNTRAAHRGGKAHPRPRACCIPALYKTTLNTSSAMNPYAGAAPTSAILDMTGSLRPIRTVGL